MKPLSAARSASGRPPGAVTARCDCDAVTWGPDLGGSLEGAGGVGGLLMMEEKPGSTTGVPVGTYYPLYDGNGNITQLLDAAGSVAAHYDYDAFGNVTAATGPAAAHNPWRFSTRPQDPVSGFHYYGYRHYHPVTGRLPNRDPIGEGGFDLMVNGGSAENQSDEGETFAEDSPDLELAMLSGRYTAMQNSLINRLDGLGLCDVSYFQDKGLAAHGYLETGRGHATYVHDFASANNNGGGSSASVPGSSGRFLNNISTPATYEKNKDNKRSKANCKVQIRYVKKTDGTMNSGGQSKNCACATCDDIYKCIEQFYQKQQKKGYNLLWRNCRHVSKDTAEACCMKKP